LDEKKPAWKAGLIGTALAHAALVLVLLFLPKDLLELDKVASKPEPERPFEIELSPELFTPSESAPDPLRFVEVNPAAPENVPDQTPLFGAQNQQVAQPVPTPDGETDTPKLDGEGRDGDTALVSGLSKEPPPPSASEILAQAFTPPQPPSVLSEPAEARPKAEQPAQRAVNALPGDEQLLGKADGGAGSTVTRLPSVAGAESGVEAREGTATGKAATGGYFPGTPAIDRTRPQERPRLAAATVNARNAPTIKNEFGSKNIGAVAYNAKWSAYGEYMQRLIDAVQVQWERLILRSAFYPTSGALVKVVFKLDSTGAISEVVRVEGSGGELAQRLCVSAITERSPYGEWTDDMLAAFGTEQELTFTFFYQ
jgi:hypothetical protein